MFGRCGPRCVGAWRISSQRTQADPVRPRNPTGLNWLVGVRLMVRLICCIEAPPMTHPPSSFADANMAPLPAPSPAWRTGHDVHFYDDDDALLPIVNAWLAEGVRAGQPMIVIATAAHRRKMQENLAVHVRDAFDAADIIWVDAHETLAAFMDGARPDPELFDATIGNGFDRLVAKKSYLVVRAYGEMVDLLWNAGNVDGAVELERLWNDIAKRYAFNLLCAYSKGSALEHSHNEAFARICHHHGSVLRRD